MTPIELETRLIDFSVVIINLSACLKKNYAGIHLSKQIIRSGTRTALNYGEARGAESKKDFIHKAKIVLKELRETFITLKIIKQAKLFSSENTILEDALKECNELISIFVSSTKTAEGK